MLIMEMLMVMVMMMLMMMVVMITNLSADFNAGTTFDVVVG